LVTQKRLRSAILRPTTPADQVNRGAAAHPAPALVGGYRGLRSIAVTSMAHWNHAAQTVADEADIVVDLCPAG
jgi:hypothetical protein